MYNSEANNEGVMIPSPPMKRKVGSGHGSLVTFEGVLKLTNDPATSTQYSRQAAELSKVLENYANGLNPTVVLDGVPQLVTFFVEQLSNPSLIADARDLISTSLSELLQHCAYPIVCTTLDDQRKHDMALETLLLSVSSVLRVPQPGLRIAASIVLRQVFSFIRQQCSDDMNPSTKVVFHKRKEYHKNITVDVVVAILRAWGVALQDAIPSHHQDPVDASSGEEDAIQASKQQAANCGPEIIVLCKSIQELSYYREPCARMAENGVSDLLFATMARSAPGERCCALCIEILWNILTLHPDAAKVVGSVQNLGILEQCFHSTLSLGYKKKERELRNDFLIVFTLIASYPENIPCFHHILPLILDLCCGAEKEVPDPLVNRTYHYTTQTEEQQMKQLGWTLIDKLCVSSEFAQQILELGFIDVLLSYIDVHCEVPAVVRWSTLQLLDLQAHVLRVLSSIAVIGCEYFSHANGAQIVHEYIAECPDITLRNLGVSVLARVATTSKRADLVQAGSIPLALHLLQDTNDNSLRVECLNLLADVVDRREDLQRTFLDYDGVNTVVPLLTIHPDYYTDLLDAVIFAAVDCIWSCVFGRPQNEERFLHADGMNSLLSVIETCSKWMISVPLSCVADLLQNDAAVEDFRAWQSPKSGRSGVQLLLSFWDQAHSQQQDDDKKITGLKALGTSAKADLHAVPDASENNDVEPMRIQRAGLIPVPEDVAPLIDRNVLNFKIYVALSLVGFDDHKELDALERGTLATVQKFAELCKDEIWDFVESSLEQDGITPISSDAEKLRLLREAAEGRAVKILETQEKYKKLHSQHVEDAERTFYKSLIKKYEEKPLGEKKQVGLTITEAKTRKIQMLKQSYKQAVGRQATKDEGGPTEEELRRQAEEERQQNEMANPQKETTQPDRSERWGPGQRAMSDTEYAVLQVLNTVRTNPLSLVPNLEEKLKYLNEAGNAFILPNREPENCVEGAAPFIEAIDFLKTRRPLTTFLDVPMGMLLAARDHVHDLGRRMEVSQEGSDGSTPLVRLQRYGKCATKYAPLMSIGQLDPMDIIMQLIVDDGVKSRIDRKSIFDPDMRVCGIGVGPHSIHEMVASILLSQEYQDKPASEQQTIHQKYKKMN